MSSCRHQYNSAVPLGSSTRQFNSALTLGAAQCSCPVFGVPLTLGCVQRQQRLPSFLYLYSYHMSAPYYNSWQMTAPRPPVPWLLRLALVVGFSFGLANLQSCVFKYSVPGTWCTRRAPWHLAGAHGRRRCSSSRFLPSGRETHAHVPNPAIRTCCMLYGGRWTALGAPPAPAVLCAASQAPHARAREREPRAAPPPPPPSLLPCSGSGVPRGAFTCSLFTPRHPSLRAGPGTGARGAALRRLRRSPAPPPRSRAPPGPPAPAANASPQPPPPRPSRPRPRPPPPLPRARARLRTAPPATRR
jgi:hypothetical protein